MLGVFADIGATFGRWPVWYLLARQDIGMRYRRSILGPFWISLAMLAMVLGISVVYSQIYQEDFREFAAYVGCSLLAWQLVLGLVVDGATTVTEGEAHLRAAPLPVPLFAARVVCRNLIIFAHNLIVILIFLLVLGRPLNLAALQAIPGVLLFALIGYFWSIAIGPLCARFRDIPQLIASVMQVAFFLTPIFWRPTWVARNALIVELNPMAHMLELVRTPLLGESPAAGHWQVVLALTAGLALAAIVSLSITRRRVFLWI